ncbi:archaeosortase A [Halorarius halobius]|uniref:archaeosortase A n=1 Tax=Halorarius halobius TaxID=2962671 RepID=UPI0020CC6A0D|nr:archaeosortase A [Halorarius halobius]
MTDPVSTLAAVHDAVAVPLAWAVILAFAAGSALELRAREYARPLLVGSWALFAVFWAIQAPHFAFTQRSIIEGIGSVVAVPASLYVGYLLWAGRDSLFVLSRAVAAMGLVFIPFQAVPALQAWLVETVARQTAAGIALVGVDPTLIPWPEAAQRTAEALGKSEAWAADYADKHAAYRNTFYFVHEGHPITYTILVACTGIGSMAIFAGLVAAVRAPLRRKLRALAVSLPVIYALNIVRNVFIAVSFGRQRAQVFPDAVMTLFGTSDPRMVSYYVADRIVAQSLSVLVLVGITYLVVRELPEVMVVVEDLLYVATGNEYDLRAALDVDLPDPGSEPVRADGGAGEE